VPRHLADPVTLLTTRRYRAILLDWDGTAVTDRRADASAVAQVIEGLLDHNVWISIVTGTSFDNVERQLVPHLDPHCRQPLIVCANRGSEVYGFDAQGRALRRWLRQATPEEERTLDRIAEKVRDEIHARTGLEITIVYDRLNRRKIDLIPLPEWADPPKARFPELLAAVQARLTGAGLPDGVGDVVALTAEVARSLGMPDARITTDIKHVEVGLTDKSDSVAWIEREILVANGIPWLDVLIAGDEFGTVAGFPGSDDLLRPRFDRATANSAAHDRPRSRDERPRETPQISADTGPLHGGPDPHPASPPVTELVLPAEGPTVISVGPEPNGVPAGVIHVGGGPPRFVAILRAQLELWDAAAGEMDQPGGVDRLREALPADPAWEITQIGTDPATEPEVEARFTVANGVLGVRGSRSQLLQTSEPRTYVAGLFDRKTGADEGAMPALIAAPDWLQVEILVDGRLSNGVCGDVLDYRRTLDMRDGILWQQWRQRDHRGHIVRVRTTRFVSLVDRSLGVQAIQISVERSTRPGPIPLMLESWAAPPAIGLELDTASREFSIWRTVPSGRQLVLATDTSLILTNGRGAARVPATSTEGDHGERWSWEAEPGESATFVRFVSLVPGPLGGAVGDPSGPVRAALASVARARELGLERLGLEHAEAWAERWTTGNLEIDGDAEAQLALRFAAYHLISVANPSQEHLSIGARGLSGDAYGGHVFWDTEIFTLPFYIFTWPEAARALLLFRYHTLHAAREKAASMGYQGALYAWESTDTGEETTPTAVRTKDGEVVEILNGTQEQHISADVAYGVWQYWLATHDEAFMREAGAEILIETARFWASRAQLEGDGVYHIRGVIGPDEYHPTVDDNAYTNMLARWNIHRALEIAELVKQQWPERWGELRRQLHLTAAELAHWERVAAGIVTGLDPERNRFEQFAGYSTLEEIDLAAYSPRTEPMDVVLGAERTRQSQVVKQADVVQLLVLLWDEISPEVREASFRYYEPRTGHGSSLSFAVHALVAARMGDVSLAERYFRKGIAIDLDDLMGNAASGVHIAGQGGLWQAAVLGFAGLHLDADRMRFEPHLPPEWGMMRFRLRWRGRCVRIELDSADCALTATLEIGDRLPLAVGGRQYTLQAGETWVCAWGNSGTADSLPLAS
jgi:trehalose/maltose hydrolase-like predicted phosphorylase